jgi:hypothetical protein
MRNRVIVLLILAILVPAVLIAGGIIAMAIRLFALPPSPVAQASAKVAKVGAKHAAPSPALLIGEWISVLDDGRMIFRSDRTYEEAGTQNVPLGVDENLKMKYEKRSHLVVGRYRWNDDSHIELMPSEGQSTVYQVVLADPDTLSLLKIDGWGWRGKRKR